MGGRLTDIKETVIKGKIADIEGLIQTAIDDGADLDALLDEFNPLDYVFIDGHHDENATVSYFTKIKPYLSDKSVMIFDDISWSEGMIRAWNTIIGDESVKVSLHLGSIGLCIIDSDMRTKYSYRLYMEQQLT